MANVLKADRKIFLSRVSSGLKRLELDALLASSECGIKYLSGYHCAGALILLSRRMKPCYFVDSMNFSLARRILDAKCFEIINIHGDKLPALKERLRKLKVRRLGIEEDTLSVGAHNRLTAVLKGTRMLPASSVLRDSRLIKTGGEIKLLRKAASETVSIWRAIERKIRPGMSERHIAGMVDVAIREKGYNNSFDTIAASGPNSAYPHAIPTDRVLGRGEHLVLDFGIRRDAYCSDLTRVWCEGRIMRKIGLLQKHVRIIHDRVINIIRPGVSLATLADEADRYFKDNGLSPYVCHGLGHGVGIEIHEAPSLGGRDPGYRLKAGMVVTVEPGLYIPGSGGVRVEDMVLVTKNGCEVLTR